MSSSASSPPPHAPWNATYRLQLHRNFDFYAAAAQVPYLKQLGISHLYLSPCLQAMPGSLHGYDVANPAQISEDLGGERGWQTLQQAVRAAGLKILLDIVPNHMVADSVNPWWDDLLAAGPFSVYAETFDVFPEAFCRDGAIVLCVLGKPYGQVLNPDQTGDHKGSQRDVDPLIAKCSDCQPGEDSSSVYGPWQIQWSRDSEGLVNGSESFSVGPLPRLHYFEHHWPLRVSSWEHLIPHPPAELKQLWQQIRELQDAQPTKDSYSSACQSLTFGDPLSFVPFVSGAAPAAVLPSLSQRELFQCLVQKAGGYLKKYLETPEHCRIVVERGNTVLRDPERLHALLQDQFYRLCWWKLEGERVNYRRFFNISSLVGIRMENPRVFEQSHQRIAQMIHGGDIEGLRVDHPDGLCYPKEYCQRLRQLLPQGAIYVEKIVDAEETLPSDWPVQGTVGYDFLSRVNQLWIDEYKADVFTGIYADFTGHSVNYSALLREKKTEVLSTHFYSDLCYLTQQAQQIAQSQWQTQDLSKRQIQKAIQLLTTALSVYRTDLGSSEGASYGEVTFSSVVLSTENDSDSSYCDVQSESQPAARLPCAQAASSPQIAIDQQRIADAFALARAQDVTLDPAVFDFLEGLFKEGIRKEGIREERDTEKVAQQVQDKNQGGPQKEFSQRMHMQAQQWMTRWQQLTPAVMAKGAEDCTFYCYDRLVSCNEVGSHPALFGISIEMFHQFCSHLHAHWPSNLLTTSTHDNKRSEDVRARINVLTEIPQLWAEALRVWSEMNQSAWKGRQPDRHAEYLLYQTLIGAWPISLERTWAYMQKACREAKIRTSWHEPNEEYEAMMHEFIEGIFQSGSFVSALESFIEPLKIPGQINSLASTLIKMTAPGIPDFYQGTELWDLSLVDPDNRRPVDFAGRQCYLDRCAHCSAAEVWKEAASGFPKLWMMMRTLHLRQRYPESFAPTALYQPLSARGSRLGHLVAYQRGQNVLVLVPRFHLSLNRDWDQTVIVLPEGGNRGEIAEEVPERVTGDRVEKGDRGGKRWRNVFTEEEVEGEVQVSELFEHFPVALLMRVN